MDRGEIESPFARDDPWGWQISAHEQEQELTLGFADIGRQLIDSIVALATGRGTHRIGHRHLENNPYWPKSLADSAGTLAQERYLFLSPMALAKTQDDQGHVRWTLFGGSDQGPAQGFWNSFFTAPGVELASEAALDAIRSILQRSYDEAPLRDLRAAGFRILPIGNTQDSLGWREGALPAWTRTFLLEENEALDGVRYVLTFRPFAFLPEPIQRLYLTGKLHLLPFPGSLVFWGSPLYRHLCHELPFATQILLLQAVTRHEHKTGIRVPQSGWLHRPRHDSATHDEGLGKLQSTFKRSHRWQRVLRSDDVTAFAREDHIHTVLFSTHPDDVGLYGKPMARNAQIWSSAFQGVLHGPTADGNAIRGAIEAMEKGGSFGYRFFYPPMQAGRFALMWHRPLIAFRDPKSGQSHVIDNVLTGYLTAAGTPLLSDPKLYLWPRFESAKQMRPTRQSGPAPLRRQRRHRKSFADTLGVDAEEEFSSASALTFQHSANRGFDVRYWETIADLAEGLYINKNSGDCVRDSNTQKRLRHSGRDLDLLGDHLLAYYRRLASEAGMEGVFVGDTPFRWQTDFEFPWMGGWLDNQEGRKHERNIVVVIPGKNRNEAVIMADHYDTAYMEDFYGDRPEPSATARGWPLERRRQSFGDGGFDASGAFMELSRKRLLDCDIWLVHLLVKNSDPTVWARAI